jgi:hypothetical protein
LHSEPGQSHRGRQIMAIEFKLLLLALWLEIAPNEIESKRLCAFVLQSRLQQFSRCGVQDRQRLLASV